VHVVELDPKLKVLLNEILDWNWWRDGDTIRVRVFGQQSRCIALDGLIGEVGNKFGHATCILICIVVYASA